VLSSPQPPNHNDEARHKSNKSNDSDLVQINSPEEAKSKDTKIENPVVSNANIATTEFV